MLPNFNSCFATPGISVIYGLLLVILVPGLGVLTVTTATVAAR